MSTRHRFYEELHATKEVYVIDYTLLSCIAPFSLPVVSQCERFRFFVGLRKQPRPCCAPIPAFK